MGHQREVFPGLDSGPNGSEGHYFYTLEKRPSGDPLYTTRSSRLAILSVYFTITKQTSGHNHENTIFSPGRGSALSCAILF